jgi:hypothetical protein
VYTRTTERKYKVETKDVFGEVKVKMIMRIYGVSRQRAAEIVAERGKAS